MDSQVVKKVQRSLVRHQEKEQQQTDHRDTSGGSGPLASQVLCATGSTQLQQGR